MTAGVVLAAGASTRMGFPKALVDVDGTPAVAHVARLLLKAGCRPVIVVLGAHADRIRPALADLDVQVVVHDAWERGRSSSVKAGVTAAPADAPVLVWPVDHPYVAPEAVRAVAAARGAVCVPVHAGHRGHPTRFDVSVRPELLALGDDEPLHDVVRRDPGRVVEVPVPDAGVLANVDTPGDVRRSP